MKRTQPATPGSGDHPAGARQLDGIDRELATVTGEIQALLHEVAWASCPLLVI
ncbi:hypothetical protein HQ447_19970 [bacterium]|nr:hypothetical protein [bacterium]